MYTWSWFVMILFYEMCFGDKLQSLCLGMAYDFDEFTRSSDDGGGKSVKILLKVWSSNSVGNLCANPQNLIITQKLMKMHAPPQSHFY
jgi:hypothetical protein